jgi:hypothetical protein
MGGEPPPLDVALSRYGVQYLRKRLLRPASAAAPSQRPHFDFLKSFLPTHHRSLYEHGFYGVPRSIGGRLSFFEQPKAALRSAANEYRPPVLASGSLMSAWCRVSAPTHHCEGDGAGVSEKACLGRRSCNSRAAPGASGLFVARVLKAATTKGRAHHIVQKKYIDYDAH